MDRKIDAGAVLVAAAALLLVISLFLDWFGVSGVANLSAWEVFEALDLVLLAAAVAAVASAFGRLDSRVLLGAALVAVVVVVSQLIDPPPAGQSADREVGAWLGLVGAALLLAGAALVAAQIAVTVDVRGRERRRRVPAVDKRGTAGGAPTAVARETPAAPGAPAASGAPVTPSAKRVPFDDRFAPEPPARSVSRTADPAAPEPGGHRAADTEATQPFAADPDDPAR